MIDEILEYFSDIDWNKAGISLLLWAACVLVIWKLMYDPKFLGFWLKVTLTIVMLPICYLILTLMAKD